LGGRAAGGRRGIGCPGKRRRPGLRGRARLGGDFSTGPRNARRPTGYIHRHLRRNTKHCRSCPARRCLLVSYRPLAQESCSNTAGSYTGAVRALERLSRHRAAGAPDWRQCSGCRESIAAALLPTPSTIVRDPRYVTSFMKLQPLAENRLLWRRRGEREQSDPPER
jgi:hypothetical protein